MPTRGWVDGIVDGRHRLRVRVVSAHVAGKEEVLAQVKNLCELHRLKRSDLVWVKSGGCWVMLAEYV